MLIVDKAQVLGIGSRNRSTGRMKEGRSSSYLNPFLGQTKQRFWSSPNDGSPMTTPLLPAPRCRSGRSLRKQDRDHLQSHTYDESCSKNLHRTTGTSDFRSWTHSWFRSCHHPTNHNKLLGSQLRHPLTSLFKPTPKPRLLARNLD
jgi:hypothetical protein